MTRASLLRLVRPAWAAGLPGASMVVPDFRNAVPDLHIPPLTSGTREAAHDLYRGEFNFAGSRVTARASGIFGESAPSAGWWRALHSFGWVSDLLASGSELHRAYARALMQAWLGSQTKTELRRDAEVTARRLMAATQHWSDLLRGSSMAFAQDLARIISRDTAHLITALPASTGSKEGLIGALALARVSLSFRNFDGLRVYSLSRLASELDRFVLPDGGPVTRNAGDLVDILADLVPLRDAMAAARREIPHPIHAAIERAMPMLRFFSHGDGGLALFQGVNSSKGRTIRALLERDTVHGRTFVHAAHSGYVRFQHGGSTVIMDVRNGPLAEAPFAFEFSDEGHRIVANCGFPQTLSPKWIDACRSTPAHSTVTIGMSNSGTGEPIRKFIGRFRRRSTARNETKAEVITTPQGSVTFGASTQSMLVHNRNLYLADSGLDLRGEDKFTPQPGASNEFPDMPYAIRFHLHPGVKASLSKDGDGVLLLLPNKAGWHFLSRGGRLSLEDSISAAVEGAPRNAQQIVIRGNITGPSRVNWAFKSAGRITRKHSIRTAEPELPF